MDAILAAVDFATVTAGIGTIGAGVAVVYVAMKGARLLLGMIRSS